MTEREPHIKEHNDKVLKKITECINGLDFAIVDGELKMNDIIGTKKYLYPASIYDNPLDIDYIKTKEEARVVKRKLEAIEDQRKKQALEQEEKKKQTREKLEAEFKERWKAKTSGFDCDYCDTGGRGGWRNEDCDLLDICKECKEKYMLEGKLPPIPPPDR